MEDPMGSSIVTESSTSESLSASQIPLHAQTKKGSSELTKIYKHASQLFLTRRLLEAFRVLEPVVTVPADQNGHLHGDDEAQRLAPVASATTSHRVKVWSLYITLINSIVDLGNDEGKRVFGQREYKALVAKARDGSIWEQVVRDGYGGREGSVDAEVVYNIATLLLGQASDQIMNQSCLETYLASSSQPDLDISKHLSHTPRRLSSANGTNTPKALTSRLRVVELFALHVLPRNEEWAYARSFINSCDILDDERREAFLQTLQELQDAGEDDDHFDEEEFHEERGHVPRRENGTERETEPSEASKPGTRTSQQNGAASHKRSSSEVYYGIEKSLPHGGANASVPPDPNAKPSNPAAASKTSSSGRTAFSPPAETPKHRSPKKPQQFHSNDLLKQARLLFKALQNVVNGMTQVILWNQTALFRTLLLVLAMVMAFSRREVRERAKKIVGSGWKKFRGTVGMGVKVSYI